MEQIIITSSEVKQYIENKIDDDEDFASIFNNTSIMNVNWYSDIMSRTFNFNKKSKEEQLKEVYIHFKKHITIKRSLKFVNITLPNSFNFKDFLPIKDLLVEAEHLKELEFDSLNEYQRCKLWIYIKINDSLHWVLVKLQNAYRTDKEIISEQIECSRKLDNFHLFFNSSQSYVYEVKQYLETINPPNPEIITKKIIDKIQGKVEKNVEKEIFKLQITNGNYKSILEKINEAKVFIIDNVSFYSEWVKKEYPTIKDTSIICEWMFCDDYEVFIEKLLFIEQINKTYYEKLFPSEVLCEKAKQRKEKEEEENKKAKLIINKWVEECFSGKINDVELKSLLTSISLFFENNSIVITPINIIKDLNNSDVLTAMWGVWFLFKNKLRLNVDRMHFAKYIKNQFPILFKDIEPETINKNMKQDQGKHIRIPSEFTKKRIQIKTENK